MSRKVVLIGFSVALLAGLLALSVSSCSQNANSVQVRSFELARQVDFVCMRVYAHFDTDPLGFIRAIPPVPSVPGNCAPVPAGADGTGLNYHLFALVTQLSRGEVAVVDLTTGQANPVVDIDKQTPGINFLPVGGQPSDLAVSPDGRMTFVAAAEPNKPAIYGIANRSILGDSQGLSPEGTRPIPKLTTWPVCALPQKPGAMAIIPRVLSGDVDAGGPPESSYEVAVVLPGEGGRSSKIITLDPKPFLRGSDPVGPVDPDGGLLGERLEPTDGPRIEPGSLSECPITSAIELSGDVPSTWKPGPVWDDGIRNPVISAPPAPPGGDAGAGDAGPVAPPPDPRVNGLPRALGCANEVGSDAGPAGGDAGAIEYPIPSVMPTAPMGGYSARDGQLLYVADAALPLIHVVDLSVQGSPRELPPLLATSQLTPDRQVTVGQIAVSPPTRDFKKYLYAVDLKEGSIMVFDVTDPATSSHVPLSRPHVETDPFQTIDRIAFGSPVSSLSFVRHDFAPRNPNDGTLMTAGARGLLCNPNVGASDDSASASYDPGTLFQEGARGQDSNLLLGPARLRGIFAFVTLSNGQMVAIDVDDWDSPCRRPQDLSAPISSITPAQSSDGGIGAYSIPSGAVGMSNELYFPMTAPNRPRSRFLIRYTDHNDVADGVGAGHVPTLQARPVLVLSGNTLVSVGPEGRGNPLLVPTRADFVDPRFPSEADGGTPLDFPGVRFSYENPQAHYDQDWAVVYEGVLPRMDGYQGTLKSDNDHASITLSQPAALFCDKGVEDFRIGAQRAALLAPELAQGNLLPPVVPLEQHLGDYVQVTDDLLDATDAYWSQPNTCWDGNLTQPPDPKDTAGISAVATARHDVCALNFRNFSNETEPSPFRDFPVLEAYDDHLVLGAYSYPSSSSGTLDVGRRVAERNASFNRVPLRTMECCFHKQVHFRVRTGGQWLNQGSTFQYLHHVVKDASGACVQSCATRDLLKNSRVPAVPYPCRDRDSTLCTNLREDVQSVPLVSRNSPLAMRNPAMSFVIYNGVAPGPVDVAPTRDERWGFTSRGAFTNLTISLARSTSAVSPQSMRFVEAFQQLAVVDGAQQGLMLFDLNNLGLAHDPYF